MYFAVPTSVKQRDDFVPDILLIKGAILTNPFYLGEPRHIFLRNSRGLTDLRVMKVPAPDAPTPEKWYAVACGTQVGIFLSW